MSWGHTLLLVNTGEYAAILQPFKSLHLAKREEVGRLLDEMKKHDVIEPYSSWWALAVGFVRKMDGLPCFLIGYWPLNDMTKNILIRYHLSVTPLAHVLGTEQFCTRDGCKWRRWERLLASEHEIGRQGED